MLIQCSLLLIGLRTAYMFTNNQRQQERTGRYGTPRLQYLQVLSSSFWPCVLWWFVFVCENIKMNSVCFRNWWLSFRTHPRMVCCFRELKVFQEPLFVGLFIFTISFSGVSYVFQKQKRRFWQIWPTSPMILSIITSCVRYGPVNFLFRKANYTRWTKLPLHISSSML
jgi:hypothetical protein